MLNTFVIRDEKFSTFAKKKTFFTVKSISLLRAKHTMIVGHGELAPPNSKLMKAGGPLLITCTPLCKYLKYDSTRSRCFKHRFCEEVADYYFANNVLYIYRKAFQK